MCECLNAAVPILDTHRPTKSEYCYSTRKKTRPNKEQAFDSHIAIFLNLTFLALKPYQNSPIYDECQTAVPILDMHCLRKSEYCYSTREKND